MKTRVALGLALIAAAGAAGGQPPGGGGGFTPPTFDGIDTDKNGSLSQAEVGVWVATIPGGPNGPPNAATVFGNWDANKDGSVSRAEFDARPRPAGPGGGPPPGGGAGGQPPG
jgi:hypothetical protein